MRRNKYFTKVGKGTKPKEIPMKLFKKLAKRNPKMFSSASLEIELEKLKGRNK